MRKYFLTFLHLVLLSVFVLPISSQASAADIEGASDHPLIGRYEGSEIAGYEQITFDELQLIIGPVKKMKELTPENTMRVAGLRTTIQYQGPEERSSLEVMTNFEQKMAASGFKQLFKCTKAECGGNGGGALWSSFKEKRLKARSFAPAWSDGRYGAFQLERAEGNVFAAIYTQKADRGIQTRIEIVEVAAMETDKIAVIGASELKSALNANGKVALYGIYFDIDKAELKADSSPQIDAIAAFLNENAGAEIIITGHSDNQGAFDYNIDLSQRRAQAVIEALVKQGVSKSTLTAFGAGMAAPVSTNATDAGRAQNRRVEIVQR